MAIQSQPSRISEPFAGSGSKNAIPATNATPSASQAASWASGFPPECSQPISAGGCPVPRNDVNGVLNQLSQDYAFRQDGGIWAWSALADYEAGRFVRGSDSSFYKAAAQSGPGTAAGAKDPTADDGTYWIKMPSMADIAALNYATETWVNNKGYAEDSTVVHKTGNESVSGTKTFSDSVIVSSSNGSTFYNVATDITKGSTPSQPTYKTLVHLFDAVGNPISRVESYMDAASTETSLTVEHLWSGNFSTASVHVWTENGVTYKSFHPNESGAVRLGSPMWRWSEVFATNGAINTSDERLKKSIASIPDEVLDAWGNVKFVQFQFKEAFQAKGSGARLHSGLVAQRIDEAFKAAGLDAGRYGLFCHDSWGAMPEAVDSDGRVRREAMPAADEYSLRYEEALCMEAAYQRRRADRAEARIAALEERLAAIEAKTNA